MKEKLTPVLFSNIFYHWNSRRKIALSNFSYGQRNSDKSDEGRIGMKEKFKLI